MPRKDQPRHSGSSIIAPDECLIDSRGIARMLCISRSEAYKLMQTLEIPYRRVGRLIRASVQDVRRYRDGLQVISRTGSQRERVSK